MMGAATRIAQVSVVGGDGSYPSWSQGTVAEYGRPAFSSNLNRVPRGPQMIWGIIGLREAMRARMTRRGGRYSRQDTIGVDVSKAVLDAYCPLRAEHRQFPNDASGLAKLLQWAPCASAVDDPARFRSSKRVDPWVGLTPSRNQPGKRDVSGGITKAADVNLRLAFVKRAYEMGRSE